MNTPDRIYLLLCLILLLFSVPALAQKTWTGAIDSDWHKAGNWAPSGVPQSNNSVDIRPQGGNPYPVITQNVTISSLTLSQWHSGGDVTIAEGASLTLTNGLTMNNHANLFIEGNSGIHITGGDINLAYTGVLIEIAANGSFTADVDLTINSTFNAGAGTVTVNGIFRVASNKTFNAEFATVEINNIAVINGTYNGDDGLSIFNHETDIQSGGVLTLGAGAIHFNGNVQLHDNGTLNMGEGTATFSNDITVESGGYLNVQNGELNIDGSARFQNNGNLSVGSGSVNIGGHATLQNGGSLDFENGTLTVGGDASVTNGGVLNAGTSDFTFEGNIEMSSGGTFNGGGSTIYVNGGSFINQNENFKPDTSTVIFSGSGIQYISGSTTFYNLVVETDGSISTDGDITVINDATISENSGVQVNGDDQIDVQGNLNGNGSIDTTRPFVTQVATPSATEVLILFNKAIEPSSAENINNYSINQGVTISNAQRQASDPSRILLTVSPLSEGVEYTLVINNVTDLEYNSIKPNHINRFSLNTSKTYYSRTSGAWNNPSSWSLSSHSGAGAASIPNAGAGAKVIIGNIHTITIGSRQDISELHDLTVEATGILQVAAGDTLILNQFHITGAGTFELKPGGTLDIGSPSGITAQGTNRGNIQTSYRNYSSEGNYIYSGISQQNTGNGLPVTVQDFRINNSYGVIASDDLRVNGTLYLTDGSLTFENDRELIANSKSIQNGNLIFKRVISGSPGWRMLSSPVSTDYGGLLKQVITQGYAGAFYSTGSLPGDTLQPNVFYYDESYPGTDNQRWRAPQSAATNLSAGRGLHVYFFGDVASDNRYNNPLPDTLVVQGQEFEHSTGSVDLNVTYTPEADTGWNLAGNPFGATIDWDDHAHWTKTNIDHSIYIWDADTQSYLTWNGVTGSLGSGLIAPFQAFWIKANALNPKLVVDEKAKTFGGSFVGKVRPAEWPEIELKLTSGSKTASCFLTFSENNRTGKDPMDAYHLKPPPGTSNYLEIYSIDKRKNRFSINALPRRFGAPIEIPIHAAIGNPGEHTQTDATLSWPVLQNIPASWQISLTDRVTNQTVYLNNSSSQPLSFTLHARKKENQSNSHVSGAQYNILAKSAPDEARFLLRIDPGADGSGISGEINLKQNYPNPFHSFTTIPFELPIQNEVTLEVFNILGQKVATLLRNESYPAGSHPIPWHANRVSGGVYFYRLSTDEKTIVKKLTIVK